MKKKFSNLEYKMNPIRLARAKARAKEMITDMFLSEIRKEMGISQEDLAKTLNIPIDNYFPSPYLTGQFDYLLNDGTNYQAIIETNRGCHSGCHYCYWGNKKKYEFFDMQRIKDEAEWIGRNKIKYVFCADSNFGIFDRDIEIAQIYADQNGINLKLEDLGTLLSMAEVMTKAQAPPEPVKTPSGATISPGYYSAGQTVSKTVKGLGKMYVDFLGSTIGTPLLKAEDFFKGIFGF